MCLVSFGVCGRCFSMLHQPKYYICDINDALLGECALNYKGLDYIPSSTCEICISKVDTSVRRLAQIRRSLNFWRQLEKEEKRTDRSPSPDARTINIRTDEWRENAERDVIWRYLESSVGIELPLYGQIKLANQIGLPTVIEGSEWRWYKKYYNKIVKQRGLASGRVCGPCEEAALVALERGHPVGKEIPVQPGYEAGGHIAGLWAVKGTGMAESSSVGGETLDKEAEDSILRGEHPPRKSGC